MNDSVQVNQVYLIFNRPQFLVDSSESAFKFSANRGKNKINYLYFIYWRHLIIKSVAKTVIEGKVHKVTTVTDHILYPIGCKTHAIAINHTLSGIIHSIYGTDNTFKRCKGNA